MIERTSKFKYLDSTLNTEWNSDGEVKIRAAMVQLPSLDSINMSCGKDPAPESKITYDRTANTII